MRDIIKTALGIGITIGLSDRESFVKQVSEVINQYREDPTTGEKWARTLAGYLEKTRDNINLENVMRNAMGSDRMPDRENIDELTKAIKELTTQIQQSKGKQL
jgi:hypothetical protein